VADATSPTSGQARKAAAAKAKQLRQLYALDLGTTKFCLASLREDTPGQPRVESLSVPADGMRRGMLANLDQAKKALSVLLDQAESHFQADVGRVVVGIAGTHLRSRFVTVSAPLPGDVVTRQDVAALMAMAEGQVEDVSREVLHVVPAGFRVDAREPVESPVGFRGRGLTGTFFVIDADKYYLKDVVNLCNESGLQVLRLYSEPFASASVTVSDTHKELGIALADIGGGTTDGIIYRGGKPAGVFTVNIAGKLMTNDLSIGLNISPEEAEKVKIRFGIRGREGDALEVRDIQGAPRQITAHEVNPILIPRIHELAMMIGRELLPHKGSLGAGLHLTGGGADVRGIAEYLQARLKIPVVRTRPALPLERAAQVAPEEGVLTSTVTHGNKFATVIGLLNLELCRIEEQHKFRKTAWSSRYLSSFMNWLKDLS
jgi:cell division protein FtsA